MFQEPSLSEFPHIEREKAVESLRFSEKGTGSLRLAHGRWLWFCLESRPEDMSPERAVGHGDA